RRLGILNKNGAEIASVRFHVISLGPTQGLGGSRACRGEPTILAARHHRRAGERNATVRDARRQGGGACALCAGPSLRAGAQGASRSDGALASFFGSTSRRRRTPRR